MDFDIWRFVVTALKHQIICIVETVVKSLLTQATSVMSVELMYKLTGQLYTTLIINM